MEKKILYNLINKVEKKKSFKHEKYKMYKGNYNMLVTTRNLIYITLIKSFENIQNAIIKNFRIH